MNPVREETLNLGRWLVRCGSSVTYRIISPTARRSICRGWFVIGCNDAHNARLFTTVKVSPSRLPTHSSSVPCSLPRISLQGRRAADVHYWANLLSHDTVRIRPHKQGQTPSRSLLSACDHALAMPSVSRHDRHPSSAELETPAWMNGDQASLFTSLVPSCGLKPSRVTCLILSVVTTPSTCGGRVPPSPAVTETSL